MIAVGDVFAPAGEGPPDESQAVEVGTVRGPGQMVGVKTVTRNVFFDVAYDMLLDPLKWRKLPCSRCGGEGGWVRTVPFSGEPRSWVPCTCSAAKSTPGLAQPVADHVVPTPLPPAPPKLGDGLRAIADMLDERERLYGPAVTTWERIARVAGVTTEQALEVMIVMKRERALFSPENPDHVRDQIGYLAILQAIRARS